jgi:NADP-dependent 3-hydroxy acid dehydrogenase YdfG
LEKTKQHVQNGFKHVDNSYTALDIVNHAVAKQAVDKLVTDWDVVVLNAGCCPKPARLLEADMEDWNTGWNINGRRLNSYTDGTHPIETGYHTNP